MLIVAAIQGHLSLSLCENYLFLAAFTLNWCCDESLQGCAAVVQQGAHCVTSGWSCDCWGQYSEQKRAVNNPLACINGTSCLVLADWAVPRPLIVFGHKNLDVWSIPNVTPHNNLDFVKFRGMLLSFPQDSTVSRQKVFSEVLNRLNC